MTLLVAGHIHGRACQDVPAIWNVTQMTFINVSTTFGYMCLWPVAGDVHGRAGEDVPARHQRLRQTGVAVWRLFAVFGPPVHKVRRAAAIYANAQVSRQQRVVQRVQVKCLTAQPALAARGRLFTYFSEQQRYTPMHR